MTLPHQFQREVRSAFTSRHFLNLEFEEPGIGKSMEGYVSAVKAGMQGGTVWEAARGI